MRQGFHISSDAISLERGRIKILLKNIAYFEAKINYTIIHLACGKKIVSSFTLKKFEETVQKSTFFRTHKSFIINTLFFKNYEMGFVKLSISDKHAIAVSRRNKPFMNQFSMVKSAFLV